NDAVCNAGSVLEYMDVLTFAGRVLGHVNMATLPVKFPSVCIHRRDLLHVLAGRVPTSKINCDHECIEIEQTATQAIAKFSNGAEEAADLLIAADGVHSVARPYVVK